VYVFYKFLGFSHIIFKFIQAFISFVLSIGTLIVFMIPPILSRFFGIGGEKAEDFTIGMVKSGINRETTSLLESGGTLEVNNLVSSSISYNFLFQILNHNKFLYI
jgi:hypothetical protein